MNLEKRVATQLLFPFYTDVLQQAYNRAAIKDFKVWRKAQPKKYDTFSELQLMSKYCQWASLVKRSQQLHNTYQSIPKNHEVVPYDVYNRRQAQ